MTEIGYWFAASDVLPNGDGRKVVLDETLTVEPPLEICRRGLHGSLHPFDALSFAPGPLLYICRYGGEILREGDRMCASERTALAVVDLTDILWLFARRQALSVIHLWHAPQVVIDFLNIGDDDLRAAARDAAWAAARDAAWAAAWATARDGAWDAARDAAWAAAQAGAQAAAWDGAWDGAQAAARDGAWDAARQMFLEMVNEAFVRVPA